MYVIEILSFVFEVVHLIVLQAIAILMGSLASEGGKYLDSLFLQMFLNLDQQNEFQ